MGNTMSRVNVLEDFVRRLAEAELYSSDDAGEVLFCSWKEEARGIIELLDKEQNGPSNS